MANSVAKQHGLRVDKQIADDGVYVMAPTSSVPSTTVLSSLRANSLVQNAEQNVNVILPELSAAYSKAGHKFPQSVRATPGIWLPGAWTPYLTQPAVTQLRIAQAQPYAGYGFGVTVALIDTGVDFHHPVLVWTWDYANARDFTGTGSSRVLVDQETVPFVDQETVPFVDGSGAVILNQETVPFVDQETVPFVDGSTKVPAAFGHGTMTAGILHLVAPGARIMPLKAFNSDGSGTLADVIEAINYAVSHGAKVISMSFSADGTSPELTTAIANAQKAGVICVASTANGGVNAPVYPAALPGMISVGSTTNQNTWSSFSNFSMDVNAAAPGEAIVTTYPQNRYAAGWGTSFATPFVAGTAALMRSSNYREDQDDAVRDVQIGGVPVTTPSGKKVVRIDVPSAVNAAR